MNESINPVVITLISWRLNPMYKYAAVLAVSALLGFGLTACNKPADSGSTGAKVPSNTVAASNVQPVPHGSDTNGEGAAAKTEGKCAECAAAGKATCTCADGGCKDANCKSCPAKGAGAAGGSCANCPGKGGAEAGAPAGAEEAGTIKLADGSAVQVINVGLLDGDYRNHSGVVAIDGEVAQVFADKGTFMLKNCVDEGMKADGCTKPCCAEAQIPVKLDMSLYSGQLPAAGSDVLVIGNVAVTETGYTLTVQEVRSGEKTILSRKGEKAV